MKLFSYIGQLFASEAQPLEAEITAAITKEHETLTAYFDEQRAAITKDVTDDVLKALREIGIMPAAAAPVTAAQAAPVAAAAPAVTQLVVDPVLPPIATAAA